MTGSIDQTGSGRFRVRITLPDGRRKSYSTHDTREEAERARDVAASVLAKGLPTGLTLGAWGERWLTERELGRIVRDPQSDWSRWRNHVAKDPIAKLPVRGLSRYELKAWLGRLRRKGLARQTRTNALQVVRGAMAEAVERGYAKANPAIGLRVPGEARTEDPWTFLAPTEQAALLSALDGEDRRIVAFAIGSGLRAGELCALRVADVYVDGDRPRVVVRYGAPRNEPTKTGRIREVPLFGLALAAVKEQLSERCGANPHGLLFPRKQGGFRDRRHVLRWADWVSAIERAKIDRNVRWHDLRHTCASSLVSGWWGRRWSLEEVRGVLGHASVTMTQRYAHLASSALHLAAAETPGQRGANGLVSARHHTPEQDVPKPSVGDSSSPERAPTKQAGSTLFADAALGRSLAVKILRAQAKGERERALSLAGDLAEWVLSAEVVELAKRGAS